MKKNNNKVLVSSFESNSFVHFLKNEFDSAFKVVKVDRALKSSNRGDRNTTKKLSTKDVPPKPDSSMRRKVWNSELAFANKLTKSVEVFLADETQGREFFDNNFSADWKKEYNQRQADLFKSARDLIVEKREKKKTTRNFQIGEYFAILEDSKVRWTALVLLILNISIYVTLFHPTPTKLIINSLEAPVRESIVKMASTLKNSDHRDGAVSENAVVDNSPRKVIDKVRLSDYIKTNNDKIKTDMIVSEQDLNGQVAGVSEER